MRWLFLPVLLGFLAGCSAAPAPPLPAVVTSIEGRILVNPLPTTVGFRPMEDWPATRVPVREDGTFSLPLPQDRAGSPVKWEEDACLGVVTRSDAAVLFEELPQVLPWRGEQSLVLARAAEVDGSRLHQFVYLYASGPVTIRGDQVCPESGGEQNHFNLNVGRGWNLFRFTVVRSEPRRYEYVSVVPRVLDWK